MFKSILAIFFNEKSIKRFIFGVIAGLAFSVSVILATIGIMDGFEHSLKKGLKKSVGDIYFYSVRGPFSIDESLKNLMQDLEIKNRSGILQTEGFVVSDELSKGVLVKGIDFPSFNNITGVNLDLKKMELGIGVQLAKLMKLKVGDDIVLALAKGNREFKGLPDLKRFKIGQIVSHGIFEKDLRVVYMDIKTLQGFLNAKNKINVLTLNIPEEAKSLKEFRFNLDERMGDEFRVKTFWQEFGSLIEAVKVEKALIGMIFQLVVLISVFNVLAFVIFLNEKKSQQIFLLRALGLGQKKLLSIYLTLILGVWFSACALSIILVQIFNYLLTYVSIFKVPGEIYHLARLSIMLQTKDYLLVFGLALVWLLIVFIFGYLRLRKKSILEGLRKEFA